MGLLQGAWSVNERPGAFVHLLNLSIGPGLETWGGCAISEAATIRLCGLAAASVFLANGLTSAFRLA